MEAVSDGEVEADQQESVDRGGNRAEVRDAQVCSGDSRDVDQNVHGEERGKGQSAIGRLVLIATVNAQVRSDSHRYGRQQALSNLPWNLAAMEQTNSCGLVTIDGVQGKKSR
jgi:hypothetical protein